MWRYFEEVERLYFLLSLVPVLKEVIECSAVSIMPLELTLSIPDS